MTNLIKLDNSSTTNLDSATVCGPDDPVLLYVHCSVNKPDPHVRILRKTTPSRIPPVIIVTGVKKESRLPKICDERPDTSVKIIVLDLRTNSDPNKANENVPASKFKKMPKEIWDNVLQIGRAFKPNQPTDCPIQTSPPTTIDVYANILPKNPSSQQFMRQQHHQQQQQMPLAHQINPYNNAGMFHPGMMYGNLMPSNGANPMMFNQPNYMNVMAAAQSIVNAATAYNNMFLPNFNPHHHQIMSPQPQQLMSPQPQHMISPQHQHAQLVHHQQQQPPNTQIKRKPVQLHQPTSYLSPQIEQRLLRKKSIPYQQQQPQQPQQQQPQQSQQQHQQQQHYMNVPDTYQQPQFDPAKPKKRVRFAPNHTLYVYERLEDEDDEQVTARDEQVTARDEQGQEYQQDGDYHFENEPHYYQEYDDNNEMNDNENHDQYYTQQPPFNNNNQYQSSRLPPQQHPYRNNDHRYYYRHQHNEPDVLDDGDVEEEDLGDLWKRRSFIQRHNSKYKSRG